VNKQVRELEAEWEKLASARKRQLELYKKTGLRGHARLAAEIGKKMKRVRTKIKKAEEMPTWKLAWAARFVAKWEGLLLTSYLDTIASPPVWTIGYGHTGPDVGPGQKISKARALVLLTRDLRTAARAVARDVSVPLTTRQRIALISIYFNVGAGAMGASTLVRKLNAKDYHGAADEFLQWDHAGGVVVQGLLNRRRAERWMFLHSGR